MPGLSIWLLNKKLAEKKKGRQRGSNGEIGKHMSVLDLRSKIKNNVWKEEYNRRHRRDRTGSLKINAATRWRNGMRRSGSKKRKVEKPPGILTG